MTLDFGPDTPLSQLRREYLASTTIGMPISGLLVWAALGVAALFISDSMLSLATLIATGMVFPLSMLVDKIRGAPGLSFSANPDPLTQLFMRSIFIVTLIIPFAIIASQRAEDVDLIVLALGILSGIVWIPHGWIVNDPSGLVHAVVRALGCYAAYLFVPEPWTATAICAVIALSYIYILSVMRKQEDA